MEMLLNNNRPPNRYPSAGLGRGYRNLSAISQSVLVGAERRPACYKCGSVSHMSNECGRVAETKEVERTTAGDLTREDLLVVIDDVFTSSGAAGTSNGDNLYETVSSPKLSPTDQHSAPIWPISPASSTTDVRVNLQQYNPRAACFNCRQMGHVQGDCTNERVEPRSQLSRGEPRGFEYIPEEIPNTEEALFGDHIPMGDNIACLYELEVQMSGVNCPDPIEAFSEADLKDELMANVKLAEYSAPTPIQKTAIPVIKSQRDLLALAPTGSGKTAAYILPIVDAIMRDDKLYPNAPYAMVLAPTHELSTQIFKEFKKFTFGTKIKIANIYGQVSMAYQIALMCGTHIVVGTPGRIKEMIMREYILLHKLKFFVLDECDRMLEMGMLGDMKVIKVSSVRSQNFFEPK